MEIVHTETNRGNSCIIVDGYTYRKSNVLKTGDLVYRCSSYKSCKASVITDKSGIAIVKTKNEHFHEANERKAEAKRLRARVRKHYEDITTPPSKIVRTELLEMDEKNLHPNDVKNAKLSLYTCSERRKHFPKIPNQGSDAEDVIPTVEAKAIKSEIVDFEDLYSLTSRQFSPTFTDFEDGMDLKSVVKKLHTFADPGLAEKWDNVGLLVEPTPPHQVQNIMLTNDLTEEVYKEAKQLNTNLIISYHPPIFVPLKTLVQKNWKERIIVGCIENRIAVYSPHTSYDAVAGGVNDWLIQAFDLKNKSPVDHTLTLPGKYNKKIQLTVSQTALDIVLNAIEIENTFVTSFPLNDICSQINIVCGNGSITTILKCVEPFQQDIYSTEIVDLQKAPKLEHGMGRMGELANPVSISEAVERVKNHLGLKYIRLAKASGDEMVHSVAVCAGSGGSLLKNLPVSLYVTGEMSHHEILHATQSGTSVIVCDHSNTERGYLKVLQQKLIALFDNRIEVILSQKDKDPLDVV